MDALQCRIGIAGNVQTSVTEHVNEQCRFETKYKTVENEYDEIKSRYTIQRFKARASLRLCLRKRLGDESNQTNRIVLSFVAEMQRGLQKM